jgi:hypothetical protein
MLKFIAGAAAAAAVAAGAVAIAAAPAGAASTPSCNGSLIALSHSHVDGATGHGNVILQFKNISQSTCTLRGYPGVDARSRNGDTLAHARRTLHGFTGGTSKVRTIVLHSFQVASADLEWLNFKPNGGGSCRFSHSIAVTPPNTTKTFHRTVSVSACDLQIHPVVKGKSGNGS